MKRSIKGIILASTIISAIPSFHLASAASLEGVSIHPRWVDADHLLVTNEGEEKAAEYIVNIRNKEAKAIPGGIAMDMKMSPVGSKAVYLDEQNHIWLATAPLYLATKISRNDIPKYDLQWSAAGDKIYFIQGDKSELISEMSINSSYISNLVNDKVENKADLKISQDGRYAVYTAIKAAKASGEIDKDTFKIDTAGTEPQIFVVDLTKKGDKPVQVTKSTDNKSFINFLADGRVLYVSSNVDKPEEPSSLKVINRDGKGEVTLVNDMEVLQATVTNDGKVYILGMLAEGSKAIYEVDSTSGKKTKWVDVEEDVTEMQLSADGKNLAVIAGETISVLKDGSFINLN
ncbi:LpqB family beta-propeller domain-containing protein [Ammoniphilus sp. YIM 78166]|uniref:LpqB family beta-propeller domain-containing protein n=1 Tax=Ammoniphilus sp. YIM 78166 TaxID=1644106 RepID=UPI00107031A7|nr:LpqB family beta-propeller domain-containing protein [Ammoniphilus sp. YIM 78166]